MTVRMTACRGEPSLNGYTNLRCRCAGCRAAMRYYARTCRAWHRSVIGTDAEPATVQHGTASTYENWHCRCLPCSEAEAKARRHRRGTR